MLFTESESTFARAVGQLIAGNPFRPERLEAERAALGEAFDPAGSLWHSPCEQCLRNLVIRGHDRPWRSAPTAAPRQALWQAMAAGALDAEEVRRRYCTLVYAEGSYSETARTGRRGPENSAAQGRPRVAGGPPRDTGGTRVEHHAVGASRANGRVAQRLPGRYRRAGPSPGILAGGTA
jgi:hypothetical protein